MKCINKYLPGIAAVFIMSCSITGCQKNVADVTAYETKTYNKSLFEGNLFAEDLCVSSVDVALEPYQMAESLSAAAIFDIASAQIDYAKNMHQRLYPASTTKILTAYVALKYARLSDIVTVSLQATDFEPDAQLCGLQAGDQLTMEALINGLLLYSGNDSAAAIAEHISGSIDAFMELMNEEAKNMGATNTHFTNPHGLHDTEHYTTVYDLYLMFNECIKDERFVSIISKPSYTAEIQNETSGSRTMIWEPTNYYSSGQEAQPERAAVLGGKTGTTDEAGSCVVLLEKDAAERMYISIIMGAPDKDTLYREMTSLITALPI